MGQNYVIDFFVSDHMSNSMRSAEYQGFPASSIVPMCSNVAEKDRLLMVFVSVSNLYV